MKRLVLLFFATAAFGAFGQRIKFVEGDAKALIGQRWINFEFSYDSLRVENSPSDKEYVEMKRAELNQKKPGKGDAWANEWYSDRKDLYEPRFIESFGEAGIKPNQHAKYTLILNTTFIEEGFVQGPSSYVAYIDCTATVMTTSDKDKVIAKWKIGGSPGKVQFPSKAHARIQEAYYTAGKKLSKVIQGK